MKRTVCAVGLVLVLMAVGVAQVRWSSAGGGSDSSVSAAQGIALSRLQNRGANAVIAWNDANATPAYLAGRLTPGGYESRFPSPPEAAAAFAAEYRDLFRLADPAAELVALKTQRDELGMTHVRFQQTFHGLRVVGAQIIVHF